jgi:hypothetical protein
MSNRASESAIVGEISVDFTFYTTPYNGLDPTMNKLSNLPQTHRAVRRLTPLDLRLRALSPTRG